MKKLLMVLLALTLVLGSVATCFAETPANEANNTLDITKILTSTNKTNETFNFTIAPVTVADGTTDQEGKINVYTGIALDNGMTASVSGAEMTGNAGRFTGTATVDFSANYKKPGIYRYSVKETAGSVPSMTYDNKEYTVDVYVGYTDAGKTLAIEKIVSYLGTEKKPVEFTNTNAETELTVEKQVTGNQADYEKEFDFKLDITPSDILPSGSVLSGTKTNSDTTTEDITATVGTTYEFTLAHGESITFSGLPQGVTYTVTEPTVTGYTTTVKELGDAEATEGGVYTKVMDANGDTVTYVNDRTSTTPTGVLINVLPFAGILVIGLGALVLIRRKEQKDC